MKSPRIVPVMLALLVAGCSMAPDHTRPPMPVPETWSPPDIGVTDAGKRLEWRQFFVDSSLGTIIATALANNRDLRTAVWRVEAARSQYHIARADLFPHVEAGVDAARQRLPAALSTTGRTVIDNQYIAVVSASWELDLWGRIHNLDANALESWLATDEARKAVTVSLIGEVANSWLVARGLDEQILLAGNTIENRRESARIARRRYEVGSAPRIDMAQALSLLGQAESQMITLEQQREENQNALALLVGAPVENDFSPLATIEDAVVRDLPPGLPSDLLTQRPDVRGAEHRLAASEANIGAARAAFFPRIALTTGYGTASTALDGLFSLSNSAWSFGAGAMAPLFDGGKLSGNLEGAKAQRAMAVADYERAVQVAFRDVADALAARRWLGEQVKAQQRTLAALSERARLSDLRYRNGTSAYLEVLEAQRDLFTAEQSLVETRRARLSSEVNLYAALGGGDDAPSFATEANADDMNGWTQ